MPLTRYLLRTCALATLHGASIFVPSLAHTALCTYTRLQHPPQLPNLPTLTPPSWLLWIRSKLAELGPSYRPAFYTDGSYKAHHSVESLLDPTKLFSTSAGAIVIKSDTTAWRSLPIILLRIRNGEAVGASSAFPMEFLSLAAAMTAAHNNTDHPVVSDALSVIQLLKHRKWLLGRPKYEHSIALRAMDRVSDDNGHMPYHVKAHSTTTIADMTPDQLGNHLADRLAGDDIGFFRKENLSVYSMEISAASLLPDLLGPDQWYLSDCNGVPLSLEGPARIIQQGQLNAYIRLHDINRASRGEPPKWHAHTVQYSALAAGAQQMSTPKRAVYVRRLWDKGWHGGNRAKETTKELDPAALKLAAACTFCGEPDSADHWLHRCSHPPTVALRTSVLNDFYHKVKSLSSCPSSPIAVTLQFLLLQNLSPARIWTSNFSATQRTALCACLPNPLTDDLAVCVNTSMLSLAAILHTGASVLWFAKLQDKQNNTTLVPSPSRPPPPAPTIQHLLNPLANLDGRRTPSRLPTTSFKPRTKKTTSHSRPAYLSTTSSCLIFTPPDSAVTNDIRSALTQPATNTTLRTVHGISLNHTSINYLAPEGHIDDNIIHSFMRMIHAQHPDVMCPDIWLTNNMPPKIPVFSFAAVEALIEYETLFASRLVLLPINISDSHWALISINPQLLTITYYDSLHWDGTAHTNNAKCLLQAIASRLHAPLDLSTWTITSQVTNNYLRQPNGHDCGIFLLLTAQLLADNNEPTAIRPNDGRLGRIHILTALWTNICPKSKFSQTRLF